MELSYFVKRALVLVLVLMPTIVQACPVCFAGSPYSQGLIWATLFLLPIPFLLAGYIAYLVIRDSKAGS
jgi:hypothetical protein